MIISGICLSMKGFLLSYNVLKAGYCEFLVPKEFESNLSMQGEWSVLILSCQLLEPLQLSIKISSVLLSSLSKSAKLKRYLKKLCCMYHIHQEQVDILTYI